jgi:hypothetical protein
MLTFRSRPWRREVADGMVHCELRGRPMALEDCLECPWLLAAPPGATNIWCRPDAAGYVARRAVGV